MNKSLNLLSTTSRVETPFIKVTIGDYTFGVYDKRTSENKDVYGAYKLNKIKYPNYIQDLTIKKLNGVVNNYSLRIIYPITESSDPNFFEKVFSSVSETRKIIFSYGDLSLPSYCYRDEEAIITKIRTNFNVMSATIEYSIDAISTSNLLKAGSYTFRERDAKPSDVIKELLYNPSYGLTEIFYGMQDKSFVEKENLIASDDKKVKLEMQTNTSVLDYLNYLVSCMSPYDSGSSLMKNSIYVLTIHDNIGTNDNSKGLSNLQGPYFKVEKSQQNIDISTAYEIDIGFPSQNVVLDFKIDKDENYSLYYKFMEKLNDSKYVDRINDLGEIEKVFAPVISSSTPTHDTSELEKDWWSKVTEYPIKVSITLKGLLRPAILMTHVRLNVLFFGKKHISSGLYIVTKQMDQVSSRGFVTTLNMVRVGGDEL